MTSPSPISLSTTSFGPVVWSFLHMLAASYKPSPEHAQALHHQLLLLRNLLPCQHCRTHLSEFLADKALYHPDVYKSRETFERFVYTLHNRVNRIVHETPNASPDFEQVQSQYRQCEVKDSSCHQGCGGGAGSHTTQKVKVVFR